MEKSLTSIPLRMALSAESTVVTGVLKIAANRQYQCSQKLPLTMANWQLDVFEKINVIHGSKPTFWLKLLTNSVDKLGYKTVKAN